MTTTNAARALSQHNIFGDHGPRCPRCSGESRVLRLPMRPPFHAFGDRVERTEACGCAQGVSPLVPLPVETLVARMARIERAALDRAVRQRDILSRTHLCGVMSRQAWCEAMAWATSDATAVANNASEAILAPNVTLPGNYMADGRVLRLRLFGKLSTTGTPTMIFAIRWGGVGGTLLANTEAITTATGSANTMWSIEAYVQTRTNGATGVLLCSGNVTLNLTASTQTSGAFGVSGFDAPAGVTVDLTVDTALAVTAKWSAASASNTLTAMHYTIETLN